MTKEIITLIVLLIHVIGAVVSYLLILKVYDIVIDTKDWVFTDKLIYFKIFGLMLITGWLSIPLAIVIEKLFQKYSRLTDDELEDLSQDIINSVIEK